MPSPPSTPAGTLGCGTYEVYAFPRGGGNVPVLIDFPWNSLEWARVVDDTSQAIVSGAAADCCGLLGVLKPWQHEIAIYRDGTLVWQGPLFAPKANVSETAVTIDFSCRDLSAWWDQRFLHTDHDYSAGADLATIFAAYHTDAMSVDTSPNFSIVASPCGVTSTRLTLAGEYRKAGAEIRSVSRVGIDWTVVGRTALVGGVVVPTADLVTLTDEHLMMPAVLNQDGSAQTNRWVVLGEGTNADGTNSVFGDASDVAAQTGDGVLEDVYTDSSVLSSAEAQVAAQSRVALTAHMLTVEGVQLAPNAPLTVAQLIPGALCRLELTQSCPPFSGQMRIKEVRGKAGADKTEVITVLFQPPGTLAP